MAYNPAAAALFAAALLLFAVTSPSGKAEAQILGMLVQGGVCCATNGTCVPGSQGIAGVGVSLNCTLPVVGNTTVGVGTTNATGAYNIAVPALPGLGLGPLPVLPCTVSMNLPIAGCPLLSNTTGLLVGALGDVGTILKPLLGSILSAVPKPYVHIGA